MIITRKRTINDATAPIVKPCFVDVDAIWNAKERKTSVSKDLSSRVIKALSNTTERAKDFSL